MGLFTEELGQIVRREREPALRLRKVAVDVEQGELLRPALVESVPEDAPARWILACVMRLDLSGLLVPSQGGAAYDPRRLLAVWLLAVHDRLSSSRQIERFCRSDAQYLWLMGGLVADHVTLCRFRRGLGALMPALLAQTVLIAQEEGLVPLRLAALDGSRLPGNVSQWKRALGKVRLEEQQSADEPPAGKRSSDPDARVQRTCKGFVQGYNVQAMVDADTGIVLTGHVTNEPTDQNQLAPALQGCRENCGTHPESLAADAGYSSMANGAELDSRGVTGYIPQHHSTAWRTGRNGEPECPCGGRVAQARFKRQGKKVVRHACLSCGSKLHLPEGVHLESWTGMKERAECSWAQEKRRTSIEPLFALVKERYGLRRFALRGLDGAQTQFLMVLIMRNLAILARNGAWNPLQNALLVLLDALRRAWRAATARRLGNICPRLLACPNPLLR